MKNNKFKNSLIYFFLIITAIILFFPIYWVITSSFKSRESISSYPPTFYPSKPKTTNIELDCPEKVFNYNNNFWLKLSEHNNTSSYYLQLNNKFEPLEYVNIIEDKLVSLYKEKVKIKFFELQIHKIEHVNNEVIILARLIKEENTKNSEFLFVPKISNNTLCIVKIYKNVKHKQVNQFYARYQNYFETLQGPEATTGLSAPGFFTYLKNSFIISILAVLGQLLTASFAAYGFSRINFKGRDFLFILLLATLMVPAQVTLVPLFAIYKNLGWINTFLPLIVPHFTAGAFNVFLLRQYMLTLPKELDESALIDGCSRLKIFYKIIIPNCIPVLIVVGLFTFIATWQDVMGPLMYLDNPELRTVQLGLEYFRSPYIDNRHLILTGAVISMLPIAIIFIIFQRFIMSGIATTGLKG
mgnify:FL=1